VFVSPLRSKRVAVPRVRKQNAQQGVPTGRSTRREHLAVRTSTSFSSPEKTTTIGSRHAEPTMTEKSKPYRVASRKLLTLAIFRRSEAYGFRGLMPRDGCARPQHRDLGAHGSRRCRSRSSNSGRLSAKSATSSPDHGQTMAARHLEDLDSAMSRARPAEESATPRLRGTAMTAARWPS